MNKPSTLCFFSAVTGVIGYLMFALIALANFPGTFSPLRNWLSDLGSYDLNPSGAIFYNIGIFATALLILVFFVGLSRWKLAGSKVQNRMLLLTQSFGFLGAVAMAFSALFPINIPASHQFLSISLYMLLGTAFVFSVAALRYHPHFPRWLLAFGLVTALADISSGVFNQTTFLEWVTVALFLSYVALLGRQTRREFRSSSKITTPADTQVDRE